MRNLFLVSFIVLSSITYSQNNENFSFGIESNSQYNLFDKDGVSIDNDNFRSNNYLNLNYGVHNFSFGVQLEGYIPNAILNYSPSFNKKIDLATAFVNFKNKKINITLGYFYEQFGSGLALRSWEDRQLGINNALLGANIKFTPNSALEFSGFVARQRHGFDITSSNLIGFNSEINLKSFFKSDNSGINVGFSYVGRDEEYVSTTSGFKGNTFPNYVYTTSSRLDVSLNNFYANSEYVFKSNDVRIKADGGGVNETTLADGNAFLLTLGYSQKGLGVSSTFRRLENMNFYSERKAAGNIFNEQIMNYLPGLTKQHDYSLTNIYVYQAQSGIDFSRGDFRNGIINGSIRDGEIGNQIDIYYKIKKGSFLGGKYGTKIATNFSYWAGLNTNIINKDINGIYDVDYSTDFLNFKNKYYKDFNIELRKKWTKKWASIFSYVNLFYDKNILENKDAKVHANIAVIESTYKIGKRKALRAETQHLWTKDDQKNWAAATLEFNASTKLSFFATDMYNYGKEQEHFYNFGASYTKGKSRFAVNYGKQRGGLLCVGGVCREVSASTGLNFNIITSF